MSIKHRGWELSLADAESLLSRYSSDINTIELLLKEGRLRRNLMTNEDYSRWRETYRKKLIITIKWRRHVRHLVKLERQTINALKRDDAEQRREEKRTQREAHLQTLLTHENAVLCRAFLVFRRLLLQIDRDIAKGCYPTLDDFGDWLAARGIASEEAASLSQQDGWGIDLILPKRAPGSLRDD